MDSIIDPTDPARLPVCLSACLASTPHPLATPSHPINDQVYYDEGYSSAGRIFAVFPLAALLCSPLASQLCRRLGKGKERASSGPACLSPPQSILPTSSILNPQSTHTKQASSACGRLG